MAEQSTSAALAKLLEQHVSETRLHLERLELLFHQLGEPAAGRVSETMRTLLDEARRRTSEAHDGEVVDAALVGAVQRIEHYEIAVYGCARAYAEALGDHAAARALQQTLDEEGALDRRLSKIAENRVNARAGDKGNGERYEEIPAYRPPTWLMTGVWMTETSGFASVPPRAQSDLRPEACPPAVEPEAPSEPVIARAEPQPRRSPEPAPSSEPRATHLDHYKER